MDKRINLDHYTNNKVEIINAKEARIRTDKNFEDKHSKELYDIMGKVLLAIKDCKSDISVNDISSHNADRLHALGYEVKHRQCGMMESEVVISW